ncbi:MULTISPECIES: Na(+)/H(+) antiporter subunit B [Halorhodospira]|uniref:Na(+)/H(+) antiporter subunit B n=1 Tax=Halorhodospira TaxID=85108 RepID=UPI001EE9A2AC|nr:MULTISPECIES: Na(+)/H(+) antiporter subunit B [Halorhodospira]MCG5529060.1 Na(+)/H(+) antiporter subunit B [Halorhodospira halophila]MCG5543175.1 Na(+)/H(+) antiporter subunit B [Halorhodospira sp. 9628]
MLIVDLVLASGLVVLAWYAVVGGSLFRGIVMFVVFGMVLALAWAWLGSPDLAMAEAAIGAGVTGALLMIAYWRLKRINAVEPVDPSPIRSWVAGGVAVLGTVVVGMIGLASLEALGGSAEAARMMNAALPETGLGNPITGVLIFFRNLDTLLEVAVLLAAYAGARAALGSHRAELPQPPSSTPLFDGLVTVVGPLTVVVAIYLLQAGSQLPGGAFQAGATLAALAVMLMLAGRLTPASEADLFTKAGLVVGTLVFCLVGLGALLIDRPLLGVPGTWAVYLIEAAMMVSIALTLALLFAGAAALERRRP